MKKLLLALSVLAFSNLKAQTTATNWTATDCNSVSHTLFNELDSGYVIVFVWVMPCGSCVNASTTAYNVVQSFASSHPGKVRYYIADDFGDNCANLSGWISMNSIGNAANMTMFDNNGVPIDENDFGGTGMPHVVVMGGPNHQIFFNKKNSQANDQAGIQAAINSAIAATNVREMKTEGSFAILPNPASDVLHIAYDKNVKKIAVIAANGQVVKEEVYKAGKKNPSVNIAQLPAGVYTVRLTDVDGKTGVSKVVKQ
jgi:hypothetical protein